MRSPQRHCYRHQCHCYHRPHRRTRERTCRSITEGSCGEDKLEGEVRAVVAVLRRDWFTVLWLGKRNVDALFKRSAEGLHGEA